MINILCFGDSNTFGTNPKGGRHSWNTRWPGRLQVLLGPEYYVIEEGMGGRTTVWDDPLEPGRCGIQALPMALQSINRWTWSFCSWAPMTARPTFMPRPGL